MSMHLMNPCLEHGFHDCLNGHHRSQQQYLAQAGANQGCNMLLGTTTVPIPPPISIDQMIADQIALTKHRDRQEAAASLEKKFPKPTHHELLLLL